MISILTGQRTRRRHLNPIPSIGLLAGVSILVVIVARMAFAGRTAPGTAGPIWRPFGLAGISVHALAFDGQQSAFAATENGVYRYRQEKGWTRVLKVFGVWDVALTRDGAVLAGENDGYVDSSRNGGAGWRRTMITSQGVYAVTSDPNRPRHFLAGAGGGIYLSRDAGIRWNRRLHLRNSAIAAFAWTNDGRAVFAGAIAGGTDGSTAVYVSRDGGRTWHVFGPGLHSLSGIMSLAAVGGSRPQLIAGTMGNAASEAGTNGIWHKIANGMPSHNDHVAAIATDPGRPRTIFAATLAYGVFRTDDAGQRWTNISRGLPKTGAATIVLSVAYVPRQHALYAGTPDGVYVLRYNRPASAHGSGP